jgi:hypothetical protein
MADDGRLAHSRSAKVTGALAANLSYAVTLKTTTGGHSAGAATQPGPSRASTVQRLRQEVARLETQLARKDAELQALQRRLGRVQARKTETVGLVPSAGSLEFTFATRASAAPAADGGRPTLASASTQLDPRDELIRQLATALRSRIEQREALFAKYPED